MYYAKRRRGKPKPGERSKFIYELFVALLVLAGLIYMIATGDVPETNGDF